MSSVFEVKEIRGLNKIYLRTKIIFSLKTKES